MSKAILVGKTRCTDPAREADYNRWYDEVHVPDALTIPHVVAAQRYKLAGPPSPGEPDVQYIVLCEIDADDPQAVVKAMRTTYLPQWAAAGRIIDCVASVSSTVFTVLGERQVAHDKRGPARSIWLITTRCTDPAREEEFNRWYDTVHIPDTLEVPQVISGQRYALAGPSSKGEPTVQYLAIYELDSENPKAALDAVFAKAKPLESTHGGPVAHACLEVISFTFFTAHGVRQEASAVPVGD